jgi:hypothetical protein
VGQASLPAFDADGLTRGLEKLRDDVLAKL